MVPDAGPNAYLQAEWRTCELAGFLHARPGSSAAADLRKLRLNHEARLPTAVQALKEAMAVLDEHGEREAFLAFARGPDRVAGRWPTRERVEFEKRVRVTRPAPTPPAPAV